MLQGVAALGVVLLQGGHPGGGQLLGGVGDQTRVLDLDAQVVQGRQRQVRAFDEDELERRLGDGEVRVPVADLGGLGVEQLDVEVDRRLQVADTQGELLGPACCSPLVAEPVGEVEAVEVARVFKALGDPTRIRLLSLIGAYEAGRARGDGVCVCDLTSAFEVTAPTISHHLKVLREASLIHSQWRRTWVYYWILPGTLTRLREVLALPEQVNAKA